MTEQPNTDNNIKVTQSAGSVRVEAPQTRQRGRHNLNVIVAPDFVNEPIEGFVGFLKEYAVVGLAVGFAIGSQAQSLVKQILSTFIDPAFQLLFGEALSKKTFTLHFRSHAANFGWGALIYSLLNFLFVLAAIYVLIKIFKLDKLSKKDEKDKDKRDKEKSEDQVKKTVS